MTGHPIAPRTAALNATHKSPLDPLWRAALNLVSPGGSRAPLSIAIFHRVLPEPDPLFPGDPDVRQFDALCGWLAAWYRVLPLDEAVARLKAGTLPPRALCITFDDGYADNHDLAAPILQSHGLCATFFIATGFLDGGRMWNDTVIEAVRHCAAPTLDLATLKLPGIDQLPLDGWAQRRTALLKLLEATKYLPMHERLDKVAAIAERAGVVARQDLMMTRDQVRAMASMGMQIGAHTVNHPILSRLDDTDARRELAVGKAQIEEILGKPVSLLAYPNGRPGRDYGRREVALAAELGFEAAVTTAPGAARQAGMLPFELPRFTPWDTTRWRFAARMAMNLRTPILSA